MLGTRTRRASSAPAQEIARHFNALTHLDPRSAILAYAMWAALSAASLLAPGDLMDRALIYSWLRSLKMPEEVWGAFMLADAAALIWSAVTRRLAVRVVVAFVSGTFWFMWGGGQTVGAAMQGIVTANGLWNLISGLACWLAVIQWLKRETGVS